MCVRVFCLNEKQFFYLQPTTAKEENILLKGHIHKNNSDEKEPAATTWSVCPCQACATCSECAHYNLNELNWIQ